MRNMNQNISRIGPRLITELALDSTLSSPKVKVKEKVKAPKYVWRPDPLGYLKRSLRLHSRNQGGQTSKRGERREREEGGWDGEGRRDGERKGERKGEGRE